MMLYLYLLCHCSIFLGLYCTFKPFIGSSFSQSVDNSMNTFLALFHSVIIPVAPRYCVDVCLDAVVKGEKYSWGAVHSGLGPVLPAVASGLQNGPLSLHIFLKFSFPVITNLSVYGLPQSQNIGPNNSIFTSPPMVTQFLAFRYRSRASLKF